MNVLAIETSLRHLSLALQKGNTIRFRNVSVKDLAREFTKHLDTFLKKNKTSLAGLDALVVGLGPGSFTGLRVGVSAVKALAFSLNIPVAGISSLDALAFGVKEEGRIAAVVDARRSLFYVAVYEKKKESIKCVSKPMLIDQHETLKVIKTAEYIVGNGIPLIKDKVAKDVKLVKPALWMPQAKYLIPLAEQELAAKRQETGEVMPIYLYPKDCQVVKQ